MQPSDLALLPAAHALLSEQSVTRAAQRLYLSVPATSRALDRCRAAFGDPLLVRSGRNVVITPRGAEILVQIESMMSDLEGLFERPGDFEPSSLTRTFTVRANEAVIAAVGSALLELVRAEAPGVELRFVPEAADDIDALRAGEADLAIGSYGDLTRDTQSEHLVDERLVGVIRAGHPLRSKRMTVARFAALDHIVTSRRGLARGPIDDALASAGRRRRIAAVVPSFAAAIAMCLRSDLVTIAPQRLTALLAGPGGLTIFEPPFALDLVPVHQVWHARVTTDPAHEWLRRCTRRVAAELT